MAIRKVKFSDKKKRGLKGRTAIVRGTPLNYPKAVEVKYRRAVNQVVVAMMKETEKEITAFFKRPNTEAFFAQDSVVLLFTQDDNVGTAAQKVLARLFKRLDALSRTRGAAAAQAMVEGANRSSKAGIASSLKELSGGLTIQPSDIGGQIADKLRAAINVNTDLIVSINQAYLGKVADAVNRSIMLGNGLEDLIPFFEKQRGITKRHAKNLALDQTRKAYNSLNVARMEQAGLTKFEWLHTGGGQKPRKFHITRFPAGLNGGIYEINDPPVADPKTGEKALPSGLVNCKCRMIPVLVLDEGEIAA